MTASPVHEAAVPASLIERWIRRINRSVEFVKPAPETRFEAAASPTLF